MAIRRVVTGHDQTGKAVVVSDEPVASTDRDFGQKWSIWAADGPVTFPDDGSPPPFAGPILPQPGGFHVNVFTLPPNFNPDYLFDTADPVRMVEIARQHIDEETHPVVNDPNPPGSYGTIPGALAMHATASTDCLMQISGESVLILEDTEVHLAPGDWVIVNGVMHSWRNDRDEPALMIGVVYGTHHKGAPHRTP